MALLAASALAHSPDSSQPHASVAAAFGIQPAVHRWTPEEYIRLSELDVFHNQRTELIDGEIFDQAPQGNPHVAAVSCANRALFRAFDEAYWVTIRSTVRLPRGDMPEPDFAIRPGLHSTDDTVHPLPLLVIEVSDETLLYDQIVKSSLYAANGIPEYWVLNLRDRQLEVYRNPVPDPTRRHGHRYAAINTFLPGSAVRPLARPEVEIGVDRMLP
ncbi:MAG TPA: Uma2 family endonuclease [Tepidisphaeraceae bacterium]|nr:Uma2 family endonuclease [Tepidisphaeraceae bacterium]